MVLVDTSSWIEALRAKGDASVRERIKTLIVDGKASWCAMVRVELWHGVRGDQERKDLERLQMVVATLPIDEAVWNHAVDLGIRARARGLTVNSPDLVIVATAQHHGVEVDSCDSHIQKLIALK